MNKVVIGITTLAITILVITYLQPLKLDTIIEENDYYDQHIEDIGINPNILLHEQKALIYNNNLQYLDKFEEAFYYPQYFHNMHYFYSIKPLESSITIFGHLFIDDNDVFHLMINYEHPIIIKDTQNYLEFNFLPTYQVKSQFYKSYLYYKGNEYHIDQVWDYQHSTYNIIGLPSVSFNQYFKRPLVKGFAHIQLQPTQENNLFECVVSFFEEYVPNENQNLMFGFNYFILDHETDLKYIAQSLRVVYIKESD